MNNILALRAIFRKEEVDLIYSHMCGWDFAAHFAAPFRPIVWHMRMGVNLSPFKRKLKNWLKFHVIGFGQVYHVAASTAVAEIINSLHPRHRCLAIPNALDTNRLPQLFASPLQGPPPYRLLFFGWMPSTKGLDTVIDSCEILNQDNVIIRLLVSAQEKTYDYVNERYKDTPPAWLQLIPPTNDISSLYMQSDMMVSASRSEGFSFCLAEALYCGLPVIYSDIPGTSWAREFQCTHQFKVADAKDLCRAIQECIAYGISRKQQIANRDLMNGKYCMDVWTKMVVDNLESIPLN